MISQIVWDVPIYDQNQSLPVSVAQKCIDVMKATAKVAQRDFAHFTAAQMSAKVAYVNPNTQVNYLKLRTGRDINSPVGSIDVVIMYQYLNHCSMWTSTVSFNQSLVPPVSVTNPGTGNVDDPNYPFVKLALAVTTQMRSDLTGFSPPGNVSVIYDDIDASDPLGKNPAQRRVTPIGELGWVAQHNQNIGTSLFSTQTVLAPLPKTAAGKVIPGWGRPGDTQIVVTTLTSK